MGRSTHRRTAFLALALLAASLIVAAVPSAGRADPRQGFHVEHGPGGAVDVNVCSDAIASGAAHCDARVRTDAAATAARPLRVGAASPDTIGNGGAYDPAYLQSAYNVASAAAANGGGAGQIVAIVDAYDDPNVAADLGFYRSFFGLPACSAGTVSPKNTGCVLEKVNQTGGTSLPVGNTGWATEISLDVDMVSAICPKCQILLVEATDNQFYNLGAAVNEAVALGADVVSNSYGGGEFSNELDADSAYYDHPGVAVVASTGDNGYGVQYPAASPDVTAVGGTRLTQLTNTGTRNGSETTWSGAGSGCSSYESKPSWQHDTGCSNRTVGDVSAVADPSTGVWVYDTYGAPGWNVYGGTSVAAPIVGAFYALAGKSGPGSSSRPASFPYGSPSSLYDVTSGSNGSCSPAYLCSAGPGYDGPTGLGTPGGSPNSMAAFGGSSTPAQPSISSFAPSSGTPGTSVLIQGSGLAGATSVAFNGTGASFTTSAGSITATVPAGATSGPIAVVTSGGTATSAASFTVTSTVADLATTYQVDPAHDGVQTDTRLAPPFTRRWAATFSAPVSYPVIADGKVFVTVSNYPSYGSVLYALSQADGSVVWSKPISGVYYFSAAAYDGGRVFVINHDGLLQAFDSGTGALDWSAQLPGQYSFSSPPTAAHGVVYVGGAGSGGTLYAVDEANGALISTGSVENGDDSSPALSGGSVFASYACNQAYGFAQTTLALLWHYSTSCEGGGGQTVAYANGRIYTRDFYGNLVLDAATGNLLGSWAPAMTSAYAPAVDQSSLYATTGSPGTLRAQNLSDGSTRWSFAGDGRLDTAPIVLSTPAGEFVVEGSGSGMLYALDASSGTQVWSANVGSTIGSSQSGAEIPGLGAGQGLLVVPADDTLVAYTGGSAAPSAPTGVSATAGNTRVSVSWSAPTAGSGPFTYSLYRGTASGAESATPIVSGLATTGYVNTGLKNGTAYYYVVKATNAVGTSGPSAEVSATPATVPGAPGGLKGSALAGGGIALAWSAPSSSGGSPVGSYTLYRSTASNKETAYLSVPCTASKCAYTDTSTTKGTTYYYEVAAVNAVGTGPRSGQVSAKAR
jgi:outer membrane protein assembly factor BamB